MLTRLTTWFGWGVVLIWGVSVAIGLSDEFGRLAAPGPSSDHAMVSPFSPASDGESPMTDDIPAKTTRGDLDLEGGSVVVSVAVQPEARRPSLAPLEPSYNRPKLFQLHAVYRI